MEKRLTTSVDPWDTRFGFFWYNDREIFHALQEDLDRQAQELAETGITHVITFSCTHFRWSFRRHWNLIADALARVVAACHRYGIRVTEHHSSHLTFNPENEEDEVFLDRVLKVRGSMRDSWSEFRADCDADPEIFPGVRLSSFRQIDGRTGKWARSNYRGWCLCFNNPEYRRAYFAYLETLYAVGVDGIMTDDVQWFGQGHSCACEHCRRLFQEQTGYEMPQPGEAWEAWHGDYEDVSYVAWLDFRFRSNEDFHAAVKAHYEGLGLRPLRPNYVSDALNRNVTAYTLDALPDLDWVFQECCFSTIIRYSWPYWAVESSHRFAVGRCREIPAMAMFYPDRPDSMRFTWGLAMSWGVMYLATPEGFSMNAEEKVLRDFEQVHAGWLRGQQRISRIGFYDSRTNRNLYGEAEARSLRQMKVWMQACYRNNVPFDLFQQEELERLGEYAVVVLNEVAMLSDEEMVALRSFVVNGGTLVWTGRTGERDEKGIRREGDYLAELWDLADAVPVLDGGDVVEHSVGEGVLVRIAGDWGTEPYEGAYNADRWQAEEIRVPFRAMTDAGLVDRREIVAFLVALLPDGPDLEVEGLSEGVVVTAYVSGAGDGLCVHLVNAAETLDVRSGGAVGHADPIPLPMHSGAPIHIRVRKPAALAGRAVANAQYLDPEKEGEVNLPVVDEGLVVSVEVDPGLIGCYGLIAMDFSG